MFTVNKACDVMYINSTCCTQCLVVYGCVEGIASCAKVRCCIACFGLPSHVSVCMLTWFQREVEWGKIQRREWKRNVAYAELAKLCMLMCWYFFLSSLLSHIPTLSPSSPPHTSHPLILHTPSHPTLLAPHTSHRVHQRETPLLPWTTDSTITNDSRRPTEDWTTS